MIYIIYMFIYGRHCIAPKRKIAQLCLFRINDQFRYEEKSPTFLGPDSVLGKSVTIWYVNSRSETKMTTFNIVRSAIGTLRKSQWSQCNLVPRGMSNYLNKIFEVIRYLNVIASSSN